MSVIHVSGADAARDFASLLAQVRAGAEIVIEDGHAPAVKLHLAEQPRGRLFSESIALAEARAQERGYEPVMDPDFAADVEARIRARKPRNTSAWD